jgi:hypothetical protein
MLTSTERAWRLELLAALLQARSRETPHQLKIDQIYLVCLSATTTSEQQNTCKTRTSMYKPYTISVSLTVRCRQRTA